MAPEGEGEGDDYRWITKFQQWLELDSEDSRFGRKIFEHKQAQEEARAAAIKAVIQRQIGDERQIKMEHWLTLWLPWRWSDELNNAEEIQALIDDNSSELTTAFGTFRVPREEQPAINLRGSDVLSKAWKDQKQSQVHGNVEEGLPDVVDVCPRIPREACFRKAVESILCVAIPDDWDDDGGNELPPNDSQNNIQR